MLKASLINLFVFTGQLFSNCFWLVNTRKYLSSYGIDMPMPTCFVVHNNALKNINGAL